MRRRLVGPHAREHSIFSAVVAEAHSVDDEQLWMLVRGNPPTKAIPAGMTETIDAAGAVYDSVVDALESERPPVVAGVTLPTEPCDDPAAAAAAAAVAVAKTDAPLAAVVIAWNGALVAQGVDPVRISRESAVLLPATREFARKGEASALIAVLGLLRRTSNAAEPAPTR